MLTFIVNKILHQLWVMQSIYADRIKLKISQKQCKVVAVKAQTYFFIYNIYLFTAATLVFRIIVVVFCICEMSQICRINKMFNLRETHLFLFLLFI